LIRAAKLCRSCGNGRCRDLGTDAEPIEIDCPQCGGEGCQACDKGAFKVIGCPNQYCREITGTIELIELFKKGLPPVAGGSLDQAAWFISAAATLEREDNLAKQVEA
jgi:hypothetical protein